MFGGTGNDHFKYASGETAAGDTLDGGADSDRFSFTDASMDFRQTTFVNMEILEFASGQTAIFGANVSGLALNILTDKAITNETVDVILDDTGQSVDLSGFMFSYFLEGYGADQFNIQGGSGSDTIIATYRAESIYGSAGADSISGNGGDDLIYGDDPVSGKALAGVSYDDTIYGGAGYDTIYGGLGNDSIDGGSDHDTIYGGAGGDLMFGGTGNDHFKYASGETAAGDTLDGGADSDRFSFTDASMDFRQTTFVNMEILEFASGQTAIFGANVSGLALNILTDKAITNEDS